MKTSISIIAGSRQIVDNAFALFTKNIGFPVLKRPQESKNGLFSSNYSASFSLANADIEIISFDSIENGRSMLGKPELSRIGAIKYDNNSKKSECQNLKSPEIRIIKDFIFNDRPICIPTLELIKDDDSTKNTSEDAQTEMKNDLSINDCSENNFDLNIGVKEIVLSYDNETKIYNELKEKIYNFYPLSQSIKGIPNMYVIGQNAPALRLWPSCISTLVLQVKCVQEVKDFFDKKSNGKVHTEWIGVTGANKGQLYIQHPVLNGLDIRFCEKTNYESSFCEGTESLMDQILLKQEGHHISGGNNNKDATNENDKIDNATLVKRGEGDCWIEFRTVLKRDPSRLFR